MEGKSRHCTPVRDAVVYLSAPARLSYLGWGKGGFGQPCSYCAITVPAVYLVHITLVVGLVLHGEWPGKDTTAGPPRNDVDVVSLLVVLTRPVKG